MTKNNSNKANKSKGKQGSKKGKGKGARSSSGMGLRSSIMSPYIRLLADPCASNFAAPPYASVDGSYPVRTRDSFNPSVIGYTGLVVGATVKATLMVQWTPSLGTSFGLKYGGGNNPATVYTFSDNALANFVSTSVVNKVRPVASCIKWVPTGPYGTRQGVVGRMYNAGTIYAASSTDSGLSALNACSAVDSNGSCTHEVKFLPTLIDENFSSPNSALATEAGGGTMVMVLMDVDATATSATSATPNGYFEIVTCWEWMPAKGNGLVNTISRPPLFTVQNALHAIGDVGKFVLESYNDPMSLGGKMIGMASGILTKPTYNSRSSNPLSISYY